MEMVVDVDRGRWVEGMGMVVQVQVQVAGAQVSKSGF